MTNQPERRRISDMFLDAAQDQNRGMLLAAVAAVALASGLAWAVLRLGGVW